MNSRLELIASMAKRGYGIADIGTDHAILPIILRQNGYKGYIAASDINNGPLNKARQSLADAEITDVDLILCDGLAGINCSKVDTIIVAGMGGDTITGILDRGLYDINEWSERNDYKLVLNPVTKPEILRYWLVNNGFHIINDEYIEDNGVICQIIFAKPGSGKKYKDSELFVGKYELIKESPLFEAVVDRHIKRFTSAVKGIEISNDNTLDAWKKIIINMIYELKQMKESNNGQR